LVPPIPPAPGADCYVQRRGSSPVRIDVLRSLCTLELRPNRVGAAGAKVRFVTVTGLVGGMGFPERRALRGPPDGRGRQVDGLRYRAMAASYRPVDRLNVDSLWRSSGRPVNQSEMSSWYFSGQKKSAAASIAARDNRA
jgi:hypothetical protein